MVFGRRPSLRGASMTAELMIREPQTAAEWAAWEAYALAHPQSEPFHRAAWRSAVREAYGLPCFWRAAWAGGDVKGISPLVKAPAPFGGANLVSCAFAVGGGILADSDEVRAALADDAEALGRQLGVGAVEMRSGEAVLAGWGEKSGTYAGFRREMAATSEQRLTQIPRKKRADVRKAIEADLKIEREAPLKSFHAIYARSLRDLGTPTPSLRWMTALKSAFGDSCHVTLVHGPAGPVAALMSFEHRDRVMPYFGGALPEARALRAYDRLYWEEMERAAAKGLRIFDFGRSKYGTGAFDYKTHWGFEPQPLSYQYRLIRAAEAPDVNPLSPKYRRFVALWRRAPLWAANLLGPHLARRLG